MNTRLKEQFLSLSVIDKQVILAQLIHNLTISARAHYDDSEPKRHEALRRFNEAIHQVSGKLRDVSLGTEKQYPDDVFLQILYEAAGPDSERDLEWALESALTSART